MLLRTVGPFHLTKFTNGNCDSWKYRTLVLCCDEVELIFPKVKHDKPLKLEIYDRPANNRVAITHINKFMYLQIGENKTIVWQAIEEYVKRNFPSTVYVGVKQ